MDVRDHGSARLEKRRLLWMLGRSNESPSAWDSLLDEWVEIGGKKSTLHGFQWGPYITLTVQAVDKVSGWT
jgi:hypothetical protein